MNNSTTGLIELSLVFGALLAFLAWELIALRRSAKRDKASKQD